MGFKEFTGEQLTRRQESIWTNIVMVLAIVQVIAYIVGFYLVIHYLVTGEGYLAATISVWVKIALMWGITITGMLWEKDVCDQYFLHTMFFWEDMGNLVAMITHNAYFVVVYLGFSDRSVMLVMLFAYLTYLINFGQWVVVGVRSYRQRKQLAA